MCQFKYIGSGSPTMKVPSSNPRAVVSLNHVMNWLRCSLGSIFFSTSNQMARRAASESVETGAVSVAVGFILNEETENIVIRNEDDEEQQECEADRIGREFEAAVGGFTEDDFQEHKEQSSAIERRERQDVQDGQTQAKEGDQAQVRHESFLHRDVRQLRDADDARDALGNAAGLRQRLEEFRHADDRLNRHHFGFTQ